MKLYGKYVIILLQLFAVWMQHLQQCETILSTHQVKNYIVTSFDFELIE